METASKWICIGRLETRGAESSAPFILVLHLIKCKLSFALLKRVFYICGVKIIIL